jgi:hypothetical protein
MIDTYHGYLLVTGVVGLLLCAFNLAIAVKEDEDHPASSISLNGAALILLWIFTLFVSIGLLVLGAS